MDHLIGGAEMSGGGVLRKMVLVVLLIALGWSVTAGVLAQLPLEPAPLIPPAPIEGVWQTVLLSEVTIAPCPEGFCGYLSKIVVPEGMLSEAEAEAAAKMNPEEFFDHRNKDPALRNRPMLGLQLLTLRPGNQPHIYDGEVYNPNDGNIYVGYMEMLGPDMVRLNGCVLFNVICQGEDWVRAPLVEIDGAE